MLFSAYQIESLLEDFQQGIFPTDKSASDTLSLSEDAVQDARQYFSTPKTRELDWIFPKDIKALVEDQTTYDPVVDYVQQSRAGRFVFPSYEPENPAPSFSLVRDHTQSVRDGDSEKAETPESLIPEKCALLTGLSTKTASAEDKVSLTDSEVSVEDTQSEETKKSAVEQTLAVDSTERKTDRKSVV